MKSLSACFLTRNEEATIGRAVRSVAGVADEVVVVDTHSDDRTAEVAAAAGAVITQFTWGDDFAAGRDYTVRRAKGDWVLWMHGGEELLAESHAALKACVARDDAFGFFVQIQTVVGDARPQAAVTSDLRLFRRRTDLPQLFTGRLHPHFHPDVLEAVKREGLQVGPGDVVLRHYVEAGPPDARKLRFNLRLLEAELHERPGQLHYLIEYGRTLLLAEDPRGHEVLAQAAARVAAVRDLPSPPSAKVQVLLEYLLGASAQRGDLPISYEEARGLSLRWFPDSPNVLWALAQQSFRRKEYADAARHLERLLALGRSGAYDRSHGFDPGILGNEAVINLGACYLQMRRFDEAEACFAHAAGDHRLAEQAARFIAISRKWRQQQTTP